MSYQIDERNPERQQLLNELLEAPTRAVLANLPPMTGHRCLDLGCGQGNTTRLLAKALQPDECVGVEYDVRLVEYAATHPDNPVGVRFQHGDATGLPFPDASFDVVFCRYLLIHIAEPTQVLREMLRVVTPGGAVVAYEIDFTGSFSHPPDPATESLRRIWVGLFQNPSGGRHLLDDLRAVGATIRESGQVSHLEDAPRMRRIYRLSGDATAPLAVARGLMNAAEAQAMIDGLVAIEGDGTAPAPKLPDTWAIATR
jgi:2-polyprenyl-3-methyl-5-hydroxy-6-metoxy-1,4-benzoquinol methylase